MKMSWSLRIESLLIILIIFIQKAAAQRTNSKTIPTPSYPSYPNNDKSGLYILAIPCIICNQLSLAGCLYIIFGTFYRWRTSQTGILPMSLRIPFYIAITDLLLYAINFPNVLYTFIFHHPWPNPYCGAIGFVVSFFTYLNMTLTLTISIVTYIRVYQDNYFELGSYDWKLIITVIISSASLAFISYGHYGADTWWCAYTHDRASYLAIISIFSIIGITTYCYISVMRKIRLVDRTLLQRSQQSERSERSERSEWSEYEEYNDENRKRLAVVNHKFVSKVLTYILVFVLQWFLSFPNHILRLTQDRSIWSFILFGISVNSGGILNGIQYHLNEGWPTNSNNPQMQQTTTQGNNV